MHKRISRAILCISLLIATLSCDSKRFFDAYESIESDWKKNKPVGFSFEQKDTLNLYHMFLTLRANNDYPFNNLFVTVKMEQPNGITKIDTLEYQMANLDGTLLGKGITDTKHSKLWFKENFKFPKAGIYKIYIEQANRETGSIDGVSSLKGITEIGFRIEKK